MQTPARSVGGIMDETRQIHMDYQVLWRKREAGPLSQGESAPPLPWQAFIGFIIAYIKEGFHSLYLGLF